MHGESGGAPFRTASADAKPDARLDAFETEFLHESFADFERSVLQDNIYLCDTKSGILLTFAGAMVIFSLDNAFQAPIAHSVLRWASFVSTAGFIGAAAGFLIGCAFAFASVRPRTPRRTVDDHIFWESAAFKLPVEEYMTQMLALDAMTAHKEKLRHLHTLARVCRLKYANLTRGLHFAVLGFGLLVIAQLAKAAP